MQTLTARHLAAMAINKMARIVFYLILTAFIAVHFQQVYHVEPAITQLLLTFASFSGFLRPLFAWFSDVFPIRQERRKPYALIGNLGYLVAIIFLFGTNPTNGLGLALLIISFITYAFSEALLDVAYDSLLLDLAGDDTSLKNKGKAWMRVGISVGTTIAYFLAIFLITTGWLIFIGIAAGIIMASTVLVPFMPEAKVTRQQVLVAIRSSKEVERASEEPSQPDSRMYKNLIYLTGIFLIIPFASGGLVNVILEPYVIGKLSVKPGSFYAIECLGGLIALGVIVVFLAKFTRKFNLSSLIIPLSIITTFFYIAIPYLTPSLFFYLIWNTLMSVQALIMGLVIERILMDVVSGERKGTTFQVFIVFTTTGSMSGNVIGGIIASTASYEMVFVIAALLMILTMFLYHFVLKVKIKQVLARRERHQEIPTRPARP